MFYFLFSRIEDGGAIFQNVYPTAVRAVEAFGAAVGFVDDGVYAAIASDLQNGTVTECNGIGIVAFDSPYFPALRDEHIKEVSEWVDTTPDEPTYDTHFI